jgi:flagellar motor switch protein FliN/FliY
MGSVLGSAQIAAADTSGLPRGEVPRQTAVTPSANAQDRGSSTTELVTSSNVLGMEGEGEAGGEWTALRLSAPQERLPVGLVVSVPVRDFRIRNLLAMAPGELIETQWSNGEDLPLSSGDVQLAWSEFEVVDARLAVRVTRLA